MKITEKQLMNLIAEAIMNETSKEYQFPVKAKNAVKKYTGSDKLGKCAGKACKSAIDFVNDDPEKEEGHGFHLGKLKTNESFKNTDKRLDEAINRAMNKVLNKNIRKK